ncbi:uncharacterized protein SRS1_10669 [Sporisorium reilianum f. sp. reilianum]|uniref:Uncharacterized protein n=1 Tax=Sporisorium reilianum f. sp. reilianum TaxID=72559 RepID=A0A2N8UAJ1_9BASI|nr:uncharacterized protein SRS1_10669 [Sporisorium reilianum f. sp. reilianum]
MATQLSPNGAIVHSLQPVSAAATMTADPEVIFNVIPPSSAKSFLVLLIVMCLCLGATTMELFNHIRFDLQLIRKPGWTEPAKLSSRAAYLCCRYLSVLCLLLVVLFLSLKFDDCKAVPWAFNLLGMVLLDSVSLVFVQRTMALYSWKAKVVVPVSLFYLVVVAASAVCIPFYGEGYRIPGSQFCGYDTRRHLTRTLVANVVYKTLGMGLDILMLLLTLHRLLDGGLPAIWQKRPQQLYSGLTDRSLSSFLIRQGFHFYVLQLATDIFFVSTYFTLTEPSYQVLGTALVFCIPPIAAAAAFREMGQKASLITAKNAGKINEIMNSTNSPSGDNSGIAGTRNARISAAAQSGAGPVASSPAGINSYVLQARSNPGTSDVASPEKTTRISWGGHRSLSHSRHDPSEYHGHGILVTVGTVSRTEEVDETWEGGSARYSSDNPDPETLEMQRQWPRLASRSTHGSEAANQSSEGHGSMYTKQVEAVGVDFDPVPVPTLARRATGSDNPYPPHLRHPIETASSPWIPRTPESPYPEVLSPRSFARNAATPEITRSNSVSRGVRGPDVEDQNTSPGRGG